MKTKAIIFDKDGTLLDFDGFWVTVSENAIGEILKDLKREDIDLGEVLTAYGVTDGITDIEGVLCKGTYEQMGEILHGILCSHGVEISRDNVIKKIHTAYENNSHTGIIKPTCPKLKQVLSELKNRGIKLAVVTTDNEPITKHCLDELGILDLFDKIYTDDGKTPVKPDPFCVNALCTAFNLKKDEVVMVGDTMTDVCFAKNAGITSIAVAKNEKNKSVLVPHAGYVVGSIDEIVDIIG